MIWDPYQISLSIEISHNSNSIVWMTIKLDFAILVMGADCEEKVMGHLIIASQGRREGPVNLGHGERAHRPPATGKKKRGTKQELDGSTSAWRSVGDEGALRVSDTLRVACWVGGAREGIIEGECRDRGAWLNIEDER